MGFNINSISSALASVNGLSMASHYDVMVTTPQWANGSQDIVRQIPMLCSAAQLPGIGFQTTDIRPHGYGLFERRPIFTNFTTIPLTFYCDGNGNLVKFFHAWMQNINNFNTAQSTSSSVNGAKLHDFQYPDWYETTIEISTYDPTSKKIMTWKLNRAYPLTVNNMDVSWDAENQVNKLSVEFFFYSWSSDAVSSGNTPSSDSLTYGMTRVDSQVSAVTSGMPAPTINARVEQYNQTAYAPIIWATTT
jgi:hypothetical protein